MIIKFNNFLYEFVRSNRYSLDVLDELTKNKYTSLDTLIDDINSKIKEDHIVFITRKNFINMAKQDGADMSKIPPEHIDTMHGINIVMYNTIRKCAYVVVKYQLLDVFNFNNFKHLKKNLEIIIEHELIHHEQTLRNKKTELVELNPLNQKEYLSNKEEIMAFANSAANEIFNRHKGMPTNLKDAILKSNTGSEYAKTFDKNDKLFKRFVKYVYQYLTDMIDDK